MYSNLIVRDTQNHSCCDLPLGLTLLFAVDARHIQVAAQQHGRRHDIEGRLR
jgi:hypothetical protein